MALTEEELKRIVQDAIDKAMTPEMKQKQALKAHGFEQAPKGMKAVLPSQIMAEYRIKQAQRNKRIAGDTDDN